MKKEAHLANEIKKLQYQLSYSEHINKELSEQLALLYDKVGVPPNKLKQVADVSIINSQAHLQELYYVEPLLMCYEETIYLLKNELEELKEEGTAISEQVQKVVKENNFLRKELETKIEIINKSETLGVNVNFLALENKDLRDKIELLNSKCTYAIRKNKELEQELSSAINQQLGMFAEADLRNVQKNAQQELKVLEVRNIELTAELEIVKNQLSNERSLIAQRDRKAITSENEQTRLKNELRVCRQQLENQVSVHEGVEENLQSEMSILKDQLKTAQKKEQEAFNKNMALESEVQDKNNRVHNLNVQNAQLQTNNNNMLQMLESYEAKVSALNKKIKKMEVEVKELRDEAGELTKKADIAEWKLAEKVEEVERKENEWKKERTRLTQTWEERMESLRKAYENQIQTENGN